MPSSMRPVGVLRNAKVSRYSWPGLRHYTPIAVLERFVDDEDLVVQQTSVVDHKESGIRFTLRIAELKDALAVKAVVSRLRSPCFSLANAFS